MSDFSIKEHLPWDVIGPLIFVLIAGGLCFILPEADIAKGIFMVIGAALTRVRRVPLTQSANQIASNEVASSEIAKKEAQDQEAPAPVKEKK